MSYRILFITPHLSTGGCPQYLLKKIQLLHSSNEVYCVEYHDYGEWFNIQKTQIRNLLGDRYKPLKDDKSEILSIINRIDPQIIHIEEMPEYFMGDDIADQIYANGRKYNIIETSHDSSFDPSTKRHFPDRFVFVSEFQKRNVESLNIPSHVVEYPIPFKDRVDRNSVLRSLDLDPNVFHVLNVGLFSPRKNQSEIIEYAKRMTDLPIQFHFIGNTAGNFQFYWEPLLKDLPSNCKIWGERSDVDKFFSCMDLFLFTSRGHAGDKETSPIVIREAISYKIPSLIYNLPVYLGMYDKYTNISYLGDDLDVNVQKIKSYMWEDKKDDASYCYIVSSYPNTDVTQKTTVNCLQSLTDAPKILTTHYKNYAQFESISDVLFDENNPIIKHSFYSNYWCMYPHFRLDLNLKYADNNNYHGLAVWTNYQNGVKESKKRGFKYSVCLNYDIVISQSDLKFVSDTVSELEKSQRKGFFMYEKACEGDTLKTVFFIVENDFFIEKFAEVRTELQYNEDIKRVGSPSNSLENYVHSVLKNDLSSIVIVNQNERELFPTSDVNMFSCVEYFSVVPVKNHDKFVVWKNTQNMIDNKNLVMNILENGTSIAKIAYIQSSNSHVYGVFDIKPDSRYDVVYDEYNSDFDKIKRTEVVFSSKDELTSAGLYEPLDESIPPTVRSKSRINIHHLDGSEASLDSISSFTNFVYRSYSGVSEIDVLKSLLYYPDETHVILKNVKVKVDQDMLVKTIKSARQYMYDNSLPMCSLAPCLDGAIFAVGEYHMLEKIKFNNAYVVNNNYLSEISQVKNNDCLAMFNSYPRKGSRVSSIIDVI
jgi:hypothetical protein